MDQRYLRDTNVVENDAREEATRNLQTGKITIADVEFLLNNYNSVLRSGSTDYYYLFQQAVLIHEYVSEYKRKALFGRLSKKDSAIYSVCIRDVYYIQRIINQKLPDIYGIKMKYQSLHYQVLTPTINNNAILPNVSRYSMYPSTNTTTEAIPVTRRGSGSNSSLSGSMGHSLTSSISSTNSDPLASQSPLAPVTSFNSDSSAERMNKPYQRNSFPIGSIYSSVTNNTNNQRNSYNPYNSYSNQQLGQYQYNQQPGQQVNLQSSQQQYNQQPGQQVNLQTSQHQYNQQPGQQPGQQQYNQYQFGNQQQYNQQYNQQPDQQYNQQPSQQPSQHQYNQQVNQQSNPSNRQPIYIADLFTRSLYDNVYPGPPALVVDKDSILNSFDFSKVPDYPKINFGITYEDSIRVSCIQ